MPCLRGEDPFRERRPAATVVAETRVERVAKSSAPTIVGAIRSVPAVHVRPSEARKTMRMRCSTPSIGSGDGAKA